MEVERGGSPLDLAERIDRRRLDEVRDRPREIAIGRDEDVSLQLRQASNSASYVVSQPS
jgi:hypothetical protein